MNKLIKAGNVVVVQLSDGRTFNKTGITSEEFLQLSENIENEEWVLSYFNPEYKEQQEKLKCYNILISDIDGVPFLFYNKEEQSVYWPEISPLSLPQDFAEAIVNAYKQGNEKAINAYKNFWILLSMNPNEECRKNLWWFLQYHGLVVSSSGFFVAYRNADSTNKFDEYGAPIFTDHYSHSTEISIGKSVTMPRYMCNADSSQECQSGLHAASVKWLTKNYFGDTGLVVLVNPFNVVAVPLNSSYGKLRCCEYIPIDYVYYDEDGHIVPYDVEMGFECQYAAQAIYENIVSIEKDRYTIEVPEVKGVDNYKEIITDNLLSLAKECILKRDYSTVIEK